MEREVARLTSIIGIQGVIVQDYQVKRDEKDAIASKVVDSVTLVVIKVIVSA